MNEVSRREVASEVLKEELRQIEDKLAKIQKLKATEPQLKESREHLAQSLALLLGHSPESTPLFPRDTSSPTVEGDLTNLTFREAFAKIFSEQQGPTVQELVEILESRGKNTGDENKRRKKLSSYLSRYPDFGYIVDGDDTRWGTAEWAQQKKASLPTNEPALRMNDSQSQDEEEQEQNLAINGDWDKSKE